MESLITTLAERIEASPLHLSGTHIASAVYGMQSMSSNYPYVRRLLKALADKMPLKDSLSISSADTTSATHGGVAVPSSVTSGRTPIPTAESIDANKCVELCLSGQETAMMMHGLRCMGSEWAQVSIASQLQHKMIISKRGLTSSAPTPGLFFLPCTLITSSVIMSVLSAVRHVLIFQYSPPFLFLLISLFRTPILFFHTPPDSVSVLLSVTISIVLPPSYLSTSLSHPYLQPLSLIPIFHLFLIPISFKYLHFLF